MISEIQKEEFTRAALAIADRKMFRDVIPTKLCSPRLGTGGSFSDIFLWDTVFCCHWAKYYKDIFPLEGSLNNFYLCQTEDGFISRQIHSDGISKWSPEHPVSFAPPLFSWIELELEEKALFPGRLAKVYPHLVKLHKFNTRWQRKDGLYFSDPWGCGMDDIPRTDTKEEYNLPGGIPYTRDSILDEGEKGDRSFKHMTTYYPPGYFNWNRQLGWVDTTCQVAFDALNLAKIAEILGYKEEALFYRAEHKFLAEKVNEFCWDEKEGFYRDYLNGKLISHKHVGGFWCLLSEVAPADRAERVIGHLHNEKTFGLPWGVPGLAADDKDYALDKLSYWRGPVWAPTMYMVLCGLRKYGRMDIARDLAERFYTASCRIWEKTGTIWENYSPIQCEEHSPAASPDFCGWSALIPITIRREFLED